MSLRTLAAALLALATLTLTAPTFACGPDTDCTLPGGRSYRIALPDGEGPYGTILFMHGYRGTAAGEMANTAFRAVAKDLGVALIAAESGGRDWQIRNVPHEGLTDDTIELAYFDALLDDVTARFPIDPSRILAAGFSAGGMMTWTLACHRAESFKAFMPVSGTFWAPIPESCPNPPVDLIHIHGTADTVVPMTGRTIDDTRQGNVHKALAMFAKAGNYTPSGDDLDPPAGLTCTVEKNPAGKRVALCLHDGGHRMEAEWLRFGYTRLIEPE